MSQWGKTDAAADSPFMTVQQLKKKANTANRNALYGNTTTTAGVFAVDAAEAAAANGSVAHTGWVLRKRGTGPIKTITISAGGSGYSNTDTLRIVPSLGGVNATATLTTNATGGIASLTITNNGSGFSSKNPTVAVANSTGGTSAGTGATLVATAGGRAGRVMTEVLAAIGITSDNNADDTIFTP